MTAVLVTGAAGRVGANVCRRLSASGRPVRAMIIPSDPLAVKLQGMPGVEIVEADLGDQAALNRAVEGCSAVIHLAAQLVRGTTPVDRFFDVNAFGTLRLLEAVVQAGGDFDRFVLASTDGTYRPGQPPERPLTEQSPQVPADYYGTSKLLGEIILRNAAAQYDLPFAIVRFATVLSPEESLTKFRYDFLMGVLRRATLGRDTNIWHLFQGHSDMADVLRRSVDDPTSNPAVAVCGPDGSPWTVHMVDVRDVVQGVQLALTHPQALGKTYNIAGPTPTRFSDGAHAVASALNLPLHEICLPVDWHLEMDISLAHADLGYQPEWDFAATVTSAASGDLNDLIPASI